MYKVNIQQIAGHSLVWAVTQLLNTNMKTSSEKVLTAAL